MPIPEHFRLTNKVALVTGSAQGLGRAMAIGLAEAGADVVLLDRGDCSVTQAEIKSLGRSSWIIKQDLLHLSQAQASILIDRVLQQSREINILVNNAGIIRRGAAEDFKETDWRDVLSINLDSAFFLAQAVGKYWLTQKKRGKIINMASMLSFQGGLTVASYTAAKSGLAGITKALSNEWAHRGINVNAIAPGYFMTDVTKGIYSDAKRNQTILDRIPAGRWGSPDDLKGVVTFLASDASNYIHGTIVPVDGGWLAR